MDDAQAAVRYREFADACLFSAKRGRNAVEWTKLAREWETLARMRAGIFPASGCATSAEDERHHTLDPLRRSRDTILVHNFLLCKSTK